MDRFFLLLLLHGCWLEQSGFTLYDDGDRSHTLGLIPLDAASNDAAINVAYVGAITSDLYAYHWTNTTWAFNYNSSMHPCQAPQTCGDYGLCNKDSVNCTCPQGFVTKTGGKGCVPLSTMTGSSNSSTDSCTATAADRYEYVSVNVSFEQQMSAVIAPSAKDCASVCLTWSLPMHRDQLFGRASNKPPSSNSMPGRISRRTWPSGLALSFLAIAPTSVFPEASAYGTTTFITACSSSSEKVDMCTGLPHFLCLITLLQM